VSDYDLQLRGIRKAYGDMLAVERIDLDIAKGEFISLLGPSGCGKSTTLMMVAGFEAQSAGEIYIRGRRVDALPPERRRIGMMFQSYALFPHMNVFANVEYGLRMRKVPKAERRLRVQRALELVHMEAFGDRAPGQLSGGQQQRVALARALVTEPDILLLDEPFSALDRQLREELQREVRDLQRKLGITTIFVTHDQEEALLMSDRVAVMSAGRVEQCTSPQDLYGSPATQFVAEFIGRGTFVDATVRERAASLTLFDTALGSVPFPRALDAAHRHARIFFRPEHARPVDNGADPGPGLRFAATIRSLYFQGATSMAQMVADNSDASIVVDVSERMMDRRLQEGARLTIHVPVGRLHVFPARPSGLPSAGAQSAAS